MTNCCIIIHSNTVQRISRLNVIVHCIAPLILHFLPHSCIWRDKFLTCTYYSKNLVYFPKADFWHFTYNLISHGHNGNWQKKKTSYFKTSFSHYFLSRIDALRNRRQNITLHRSDMAKTPCQPPTFLKLSITLSIFP
jgi:hypothetical protein